MCLLGLGWCGYRGKMCSLGLGWCGSCLVYIELRQHTNLSHVHCPVLAARMMITLKQWKGSRGQFLWDRKNTWNLKKKFVPSPCSTPIFNCMWYIYMNGFFQVYAKYPAFDLSHKKEFIKATVKQVRILNFQVRTSQRIFMVEIRAITYLFPQ